MGLLCAKGRLGKILQVKVRPLSKLQVLPTTQRGQRVVVTGLQTLPEALLRFAPVVRESRFPVPDTTLIPVPHPPDFRLLAFIQAPIISSRSCHSQSPV